MKTHNLKIIFIAFVTVFLSSCTNLLYTSLDVLRPAKVAFAPEAKNLLIVNNTVVQPPEIGHVTQLLNENPRNILLQSDSLSIFCLGALTEELNGKNFFSSVLLIPESKNNSRNFNQISTLNADSVHDLCFAQKADAILSLDKIKVNDDLSEYYLTETGTFLATLEVKYETSWSIYYPNKPEIATMQFKDTVYWESESYFRKKGMSELPNRGDALVDGALNVGQKSVNRFVPYWEKADRFFFNPHNKLMKKGMDSVYVKNWKSAIEYWESALKKTKSTWIKAQATNNIAIAYEILGDIDKALDYATQSYYSLGTLSFVDYDSFFRVAEYINELTQRKKDIAKLKIQLGE
ncbi:MAG: DUF6340 family protein [Paludibacter sp.]